MATQTDIPSDLPDDYKIFVFYDNDSQLNTGLLYALLHGRHRRSVSRHVEF